MGKKLSREDYRRIKGYSKEEMTRWLDYHESMMYNLIRKEFEANYQDEIENSIAINNTDNITYIYNNSNYFDELNDEINNYYENFYSEN